MEDQERDGRGDQCTSIMTIPASFIYYPIRTHNPSIVLEPVYNFFPTKVCHDYNFGLQTSHPDFLQCKTGANTVCYFSIHNENPPFQKYDASEPSYPTNETRQYDGYTIQTNASQRKCSCNIHYWNGPNPEADCEVFCGGIPRDLLEFELLSLFEPFGTIWGLRLIMNLKTGKNRGFAFIRYTSETSAMDAVKKLHRSEIRPFKYLTVKLSTPKRRLFIGNIPTSVSQEELKAEFGRRTNGLEEVIVQPTKRCLKKNKGFCFLEFDTHTNAYLSMKRLINDTYPFWGRTITVGWAENGDEPNGEVMEEVRTLYVGNLAKTAYIKRLKRLFSRFGPIGRLRKIRDFAFVHFKNREDAALALDELNGSMFYGTEIEVTWAKPAESSEWS